MQGFVDWLRTYNSELPVERRTGIYGLDLYSMGSSMRAVINYLEGVDTHLAQEARKRYKCLEPWTNDPSEYGLRALRQGYAPCEAGVVQMLRELMENRMKLAAEQPGNGERFFDAEMNARLVKDSETYYRAMFWGDAESWNLRDTHMFETLERLLKTKGGKAVVWAHNSHLGDARATGMKERRELNLGQLCRERLETAPGQVAIIGMGTHDGEVAASDNWDDDMRIITVNPSRSDSWERVMHDTGIPRFLLDMRPGYLDDEARHSLAEVKKERFIGVIYRPATEKWSHYVESSLSKQFDAYLWIDRTSAVEAFEVHQPHESVARGETYPFGL